MSQLTTILKTKRSTLEPCEFDMHLIFSSGTLCIIPDIGENLFFQYQGQSMFLAVRNRLFEIIPHEGELIYEITLVGSYYMNAAGIFSEV